MGRLVKPIRTLEEKRLEAEKGKLQSKNYLERERTKCFKLGHIVFVPTYTRSNAITVEYVGPEFMSESKRRYTEFELRRMGAVATEEYLWKRASLNGR